MNKAWFQMGDKICKVNKFFSNSLEAQLIPIKIPLLKTWET